MEVTALNILLDEVLIKEVLVALVLNRLFLEVLKNRALPEDKSKDNRSHKIYRALLPYISILLGTLFTVVSFNIS